MNKKAHDPLTFYGVATVGPKGQVVIPIEARHRMAVKPGDKIVIVGPSNKPEFVGLCNEATFNEILGKIGTKLDKVKQDLGRQKEI